MARVHYVFRRSATRWLATLALAAISGCSAPPHGKGPLPRAAPASIPPANSIGININALSRESSQIPFVDVFKETQPWVFSIRPDGDGGGSRQSRIGPDGWVASLAGDEQATACAFQKGGGHFPGGVYTVFYNGKGELTFNSVGQVIESTPGRMKVQVTPGDDEGLCVIERSTDPSDPIRDIRVIMPGFENTYQQDPFYPPFLRLLAPFRTIRLIGWDQPIRSAVVRWADRRPAAYATQALSANLLAAPATSTGVAYEYQIALANRLGANPWFLIPTKADDDYIRQLAILTHRTLRPDLHPMIEFSDEIWNQGFPDARYAAHRGFMEGLDWNLLSKAPNAGLYWYAKRAGRMFDIWNGVWGADAGRIVHVISGQQSRPAEADIILGWHDTYKKADVLAINSYAAPFNLYHVKAPAQLDAISRMDVGATLDKLEDTVNTLLRRQWAAHRRIADKYAVGLVIYEGGPDFTTRMATEPYRTAITTLWSAAGRDPRMEKIYGEMLDQLNENHINLFSHFEDINPVSIYGSFGLVEHQDQDPETSPKFRALEHYVASHPTGTWKRP